MWLLIFAVLTAMWFFHRSRTRLRVDARPPRLVGDGSYGVEVVGESNYMASFEKICGRRTADCINRKTEAHLTLEDDNRFDKHAVRVSIEGYTVGHLPRAVARDFRRAVIGVGLDGSTVFECGAHIRGGWDRGIGRQGDYGVWLDLPESGGI